MSALKKIRIVGAVLIGIQFILSVLIVYFVISLKAIPVKHSLLLAVILGIMAIVEMLMLLKKQSGIAAIIISVLFIGILIYGIYIVRTTDKALESVTGNKVEYEQINVYVKKDDPANSLSEAVQKNYYFGYVDNSNDESIDATVKEINDSHNTNILTQEYASIIDLAAAMDKHEVQAIITSTGMIDVLNSSEEYPNYGDNLKIIMEHEVELEVNKNEAEEKKTIDADRYSIYISGIDTYGSVTLKSRSDVNIIAVMNEVTHTILLISTPRDYYVYLSNSGSTKDKLTHAGIYGIDVSMDTLELIYDTDLTYYVRMNFSGFEGIIDKLGGVDVHSDYTFSFDEYQYYEGENHLDGRGALMFARDRTSFAGGDRQRGENQMQVIKAVFSKLMSSQMLANYSDIMDELSNCFQTNMSKSQIGQFVQEQLDSGKEWKVLTFSVNGGDSEGYCYSLGGNAYVMVPFQEDLDFANKLIRRMMADENITQQEIDAYRETE